MVILSVFPSTENNSSSSNSDTCRIQVTGTLPEWRGTPTELPTHGTTTDDTGITAVYLGPEIAVTLREWLSAGAFAQARDLDKMEVSAASFTAK